jgi:hypothetical protein
MGHETSLRTAIAYLADLDAELEERSALRDPGLHAAAHEDMRYQLEQARQLVACMEQQASNVSCMSLRDGREMLFDLDEVRGWCRRVEASIARVCCGEAAAAAA